jgi:hypothetical protein
MGVFKNILISVKNNKSNKSITKKNKKIKGGVDSTFENIAKISDNVDNNIIDSISTLGDNAKKQTENVQKYYNDHKYHNYVLKYNFFKYGKLKNLLNINDNNKSLSLIQNINNIVFNYSFK